MFGSERDPIEDEEARRKIHNALWIIGALASSLFIYLVGFVY